MNSGQLDMSHKIKKLHSNPLPSELTAYLLKSRGFGGIEVLPLHPVEWESRQDYVDPMLAYLQDKLFGPQDYGVGEF